MADTLATPIFGDNSNKLWIAGNADQNIGITCSFALIKFRKASNYTASHNPRFGLRGNSLVRKT
ncbi:hypothetical protein [uncultured Ruegeria sp.]|uniref:hypothetical protein n=1 Tax=uncultured Ruegeria sp. TaxID=259304 RepID=UPI002611E832|nr:hypothetical protein [uncultured Ruegeria sp.]